MNRRRIAASLAALVVPATLIVGGVSSPAEAGTPGCITKAEYGKLRYGTPIKKVRNIVGARGKTTSSSSFSDGDKWKTLEFRQCGSRYGGASISFESTEREVYVPDEDCYDFDGDGYEEECYDYGYYETRYKSPLRQESKYAYWY